MISRQKLYALSRSKPFLLKVCAGILTAAALVALVISLAPSRHLDFQSLIADSLNGTSPQGTRLIDQVENILTDPDTSPEEMAQTIRTLDAFILAYYLSFASPGALAEDFHQSNHYLEDFDLTHLLDIIAKTPLDPSERPLFEALIKVLFAAESSAEHEDGLAYLTTHANMTPPVRFANEFLGDLSFKNDQYSPAVDHYRAEAHLPNTPYARERWISLLLSLERTEELQAALQEAAVRDSLTPRQWMHVAIVQKDWKMLVRSVFLLEFGRAIGPEWFLAVLAGSVWFLILTQFARFTWPRLLFYLLAVGAGVLSATATLIAVILQENFGGMSEGGNWIEHAIYYVVGVGVREELIKLVFFLPFLPVLLIRKQHAEALIVAACVGLGFALQENIGYYERNNAANAIGRFISANFLHLSLTGMLGYSLYKMGLQWKRYWEEFVGTFIFVVVLHGAYDAFIAVPELSEFSILSIILFVVMAYRFFDQVESVREHGQLIISPLAVFLVGFSILVGVTINYMALESTLRNTILAVGSAFLSAAPIAFVYINRFRDQ